MAGGDRIPRERHAFEQQRRIALHQVLVDVRARIALVAVGDDELLLARGSARKLPFQPPPGAPRRRARARSRPSSPRAAPPASPFVVLGPAPTNLPTGSARVP